MRRGTEHAPPSDERLSWDWDFPTRHFDGVNATTVKPLLRETYDEWSRHNAAQLGASLSYYAVLSLAPLIVVLLAIIGLVYGADAARGNLQTELQRFMGYEAADAIQQVVASASSPTSGVIATIVGVLTLLLGASGVAIALQQSLNIVWDVPPRATAKWWGPYVREKLTGFVAVLGAGFLLVVSLAVTAAIAVLEKFFTYLLPIPGAVLQFTNSIFSLAITTLLFALLFRTLPDLRIAWRRVWVGAAVTALLFTIGKYLIGIYLGRAGVGSAYGAAGSLVVVLVWVYYSAQVFFFGAEFTHVYAKAQAAQARANRQMFSNGRPRRFSSSRSTPA
jgi:membrane protein